MHMFAHVDTHAHTHLEVHMIVPASMHMSAHMSVRVSAHISTHISTHVYTAGHRCSALPSKVPVPTTRPPSQESSSGVSLRARPPTRQSTLRPAASTRSSMRGRLRINDVERSHRRVGRVCLPILPAKLCCQPNLVGREGQLCSVFRSDFGIFPANCGCHLSVAKCVTF